MAYLKRLSAPLSGLCSAVLQYRTPVRCFFAAANTRSRGEPGEANAFLVLSLSGDDLCLGKRWQAKELTGKQRQKGSSGASHTGSFV